MNCLDNDVEIEDDPNIVQVEDYEDEVGASDGNGKCEVNRIPSIGLKVYSEDQAYNLYNEYATEIGFSIRRGNVRRNTKGVVRQREYVCSKQGFREDEETFEARKINRLETRTGCKASIRFTVTDEVWEITHFNPHHNHDLVEPDQRKFLRSNRKIKEETASVISSMVSAGIKPAQTYSFITKEVGVADNVGFTRRDCHSFLRTERMNTIEAGDAQSLINHFKYKLAEDPMFFYTVQVDDQNRMANFFWRDGRSRLDYDCFGDVVMFDTTCRTNKYNMVCAPFVGVNHHKKNVLFGCAFLLDETTTSFIWLFETFLESMGNRHPKTIFTDQCQAMANAIEKVFLGTCHRLCPWHISKNATQHLASCYANPEFKKMFNKCLNGCSTEIEFQSTWDELIENFNLADNNWLKTLYQLRGKWCPAFSLDTFSANMRSTQRSESTNNVFHHMSSKMMTLTQFVHQYEDMAERMRLSELEEDFRCNQGLPKMATRSSGILKQAVDLYTIEIFKLFQKEMIESLSIVNNEVGSDGTVHTYQLTEEGHRRVHIVNFNSFNCTVTCSCKHFESMGLLCRHALRVLNMRSVTKIPDQYILKRWTKYARKGTVVPNDSASSLQKAKSSRVFLRSKLMHLAFTAIEKSLMITEGAEIVEVDLNHLIKKVERKMATENVVDGANSNEDANDDSNDLHCSVNETLVADPPRVRQKGVTNARLRSQLENKRKRKSLKSGQEKQQNPTSKHPASHPPQNPISMHPPQNPTSMHPPFHPSGVQNHASSHRPPPFCQGSIPSWILGDPSFRITSMLQGTDQMPQASQDSSTSFTASYTVGESINLS